MDDNMKGTVLLNRDERITAKAQEVNSSAAKINQSLSSSTILFRERSKKNKPTATKYVPPVPVSAEESLSQSNFSENKQERCSLQTNTKRSDGPAGELLKETVVGFASELLGLGGVIIEEVGKQAGAFFGQSSQNFFKSEPFNEPLAITQELAQIQNGGYDPRDEENYEPRKHGYVSLPSSPR